MCKYCEPTTPMFKNYSEKQKYFDEIDGGNPIYVLGQRVNVCHPIVGDYVCGFAHTDEPQPVELSDLSDREIWIDGNKLFAETSGREYAEVFAKIKFCPMCGRQLDDTFI